MIYAWVFAIFGILDIIVVAVFLLNWRESISHLCPLILHGVFMFVLALMAFGNVYVLSKPVPSAGNFQEMGAILNDCTDEASQVPENLVQTESNITNMMTKRIPPQATLMVVGFIVNFILIAMYVLTQCGCCKKEVPATSINRD